MAAAMASPTPVLPEVGSTIVPPGRRSPSRSAASMRASPIRSFSEPPGFRYSSLASTSAPPGGESFCSRTIGVPPTSSSTVGYRRDMARSLVPEVAPAGEDHRGADLLDRRDHLCVALRAARLNDRLDARHQGGLRAVGEGEEGV